MTLKTIDHPRFLRSYVGSKRRWLPAIRSIADQKPIAELFVGSAAISAEYASSALIVDTDVDVTRVLRQFDELIVPDEFSVGDYNRARPTADWWLYSYYRTAMSFGGSCKKTPHRHQHHDGGASSRPRSASEPVLVFVDLKHSHAQIEPGVLGNRLRLALISHRDHPFDDLTK